MENEWAAAIGVGVFFLFAIFMTLLVRWIRKKKIEPRLRRLEEKFGIKQTTGKWKR